MRRFIFIAVILVAAAAGLYFGLQHGAHSRKQRGPVLEITFTDASLGNAIILRTPDNRFVIFDPGPRATSRDLAAALTEAGARMLDIVVTEPTDAHTGAIDTLSQQFKLKRIVHGEAPMWNKPKGVPELALAQGDSIHLSRGIRLEVLGPPRGPVGDSAQDTAHGSLITRIRFGRTSFLLASHAAVEAEAALMRSGQDLSSSVLVVGRHGRAGSTTLELLSAVRPGYCVVQVGKGADRPSRSVLSRLSPDRTGAELYRSDAQGSIRMISSGRAITVETGGGIP